MPSQIYKKGIQGIKIKGIKQGAIDPNAEMLL